MEKKEGESSCKSNATVSLLLLIVLTGFFVCSQSVSAQQSSYIGASYLLVEVSMSSQLGLVHERSSSYFDWVSVNLTFYPKEHPHQEIKSLIPSPQSQVPVIEGASSLDFSQDTTGTGIVYLISEPEGDEVDFGYSSLIKTRHSFTPVEERNPFPLQLSADERKKLAKYLAPAENADSSDPSIVSLANELAAGQNDQYLVVYLIGEWIQEHVEYSLSTLTSDASQKASWVLENRYGVCDEITTLFIAMLRSLGIPARYVAGLAYTEYELLPEGFGPHGWAEVWFPTVGWVPFDLTYDEYGFLDSSHIVMQVTNDAGHSTTSYNWRGLHADVKPGRLSYDENVATVGPQVNDRLDMELVVLGPEVEIGSYNLAMLKVKNPYNYYYSTTIYAIESQGLVSLSEPKRRILLAPLEEKTFFFPIRVDPSLQQGFTYTFTVGFYSSTNQTITEMFQARRGFPLIPKNEVDSVIAKRDVKTESTVTTDLELSCILGDKTIYYDETAKLVCTVGNKGNVMIDVVEVCLFSQCSNVTLGISQEMDINFEYVPVGIGTHSLLIDAIPWIGDEKADIVTTTVPLKVEDRPHLEISTIESPESVLYSETFSVAFIVNKTSESLPQKVTITFEGPGFSKSWDLDTIEGTKEFVLNMNSGQFVRETTSNHITLLYHDTEGKLYTMERDVTVSLRDLTLVDKVSMSARIGELWLRDNPGAIYVLVGCAVLIVLVSLVRMHKRRRQEY